MNKVALVTGASKGVGKAIVIELAKRHIFTRMVEALPVKSG